MNQAPKQSISDALDALLDSSAAPAIRHYYKIWQTLKQKGRCILHIEPRDLRRFRTAISEEKARDKHWLRTNFTKTVYTETVDREGKYTLVLTLKKIVKLKGRIGTLL